MASDATNSSAEADPKIVIDVVDVGIRYLPLDCEHFPLSALAKGRSMFPRQTSQLPDWEQHGRKLWGSETHQLIPTATSQGRTSTCSTVGHDNNMILTSPPDFINQVQVGIRIPTFFASFPSSCLRCRQVMFSAKMGPDVVAVIPFFVVESHSAPRWTCPRFLVQSGNRHRHGISSLMLFLSRCFLQVS